MRGYYILTPIMLALSLLVGWFASGRALRPVNDLARTAEEITSSRMDLRIPLRKTGDELDHLIETFNRMLDRLSEGFNQIRQFSTDVSHELRTPLTAIRGQIEVALFTARSTEQFRDAMVNALQDVERMTQVVNSLLLLSRAESGQLVLDKVQLNPADVAADSVDSFQIPAEEAGVNLRTELQPGCSVEGDRLQLERLFNNLLSNAVKYTPAGGTITVSVRNSGGEDVELVVEDTGKGIPAEALPHIFDRFYRVRDGQDAEKGLGLGLSFVAWIVKAHGGRVNVESTLGSGSRFTVRLPSAKAHSGSVE
jgi:heavy metal sensor kinase